MNSGRGGIREGAGAPSKWNYGKTQTIRVPVCLSDKLLEIAKKLDRDEFIDYDTKSINLSAVKIYKLHGREVIRLEDLERLGFVLNRELG